MNKTTKTDMLSQLALMRRAILDEMNDFNHPEVRAALAQFLNSLEAYIIDKEQW